MNDDYYRRVCEAAELCIVCKHFTISDETNLMGDCANTNNPEVLKYAWGGCESGNGWERRPQPWEGETCGTCEHFDCDYPPTGCCSGEYRYDSKACKEWSEAQ